MDATNAIKFSAMIAVTMRWFAIHPVTALVAVPFAAEFRCFGAEKVAAAGDEVAGISIRPRSSGFDSGADKGSGGALLGLALLGQALLG